MCSYARQLIEETIRRNASPSRPEEASVTGTGAMGSNSSLNSSASDENSRPQRLSDTGRGSARRSTSLLVHSLSTNDASVGEYKYTVTVGNSALRITGPDLKLVRVSTGYFQISLGENFIHILFLLFLLGC